MRTEENGHGSDNELTWPDQLRAVFEAIAPMEGAVNDLTHWFWEHVVAKDCLPCSLPPEVADSLQRLSAAIEAARDASTQAFERFSSHPIQKCFTGKKFTEEEFYILRGMGVIRDMAKNLGLSEMSDYEALSMLYYEDDEGHGYINPGEEPLAKGRLKWRWGIVPETVRIKFLRKDQEEFLRRKIPSLYGRFLRE